ncbi:hypothetical protein JCM11641_005334 [Rhodosporidiobolus odoratus]
MARPLPNLAATTASKPTDSGAVWTPANERLLIAAPVVDFLHLFLFPKRSTIDLSHRLVNVKSIVKSNKKRSQAYIQRVLAEKEKKVKTIDIQISSLQPLFQATGLPAADESDYDTNAEQEKLVQVAEAGHMSTGAESSSRSTFQPPGPDGTLSRSIGNDNDASLGHLDDGSMRYELATVSKGKKRSRSWSSEPLPSDPSRTVHPASLSTSFAPDVLFDSNSEPISSTSFVDSPASNFSSAYTSNLVLPPANLPESSKAPSLPSCSCSSSTCFEKAPTTAPFSSHPPVSSEPISNYYLPSYESISSSTTSTHTPSPGKLKTKAIFEETRAKLWAFKECLEEWPKGL